VKIMSEEELREVKRRKEKILARVEEKRRQAEMKLRMQMLGSSGDVEENLDLSFPMPSSVTPPAESLLRPDPIGRSSVDASENLGKGYVIPPMATSQSVTQPVIPHRPPPPVYHEREPVIPHRPPPPVYHEREPVIPHRPPLSSVIPPQIQMRGIEALEGPESTGMATPHRPTRAEIDARQFAARSHSLMPSVTAPPPSVVDGINVAPGAKNAGVPGNRSRIAELFGLSDATRQRNFNQQAFDERTHGEGQRFFNQRFGTSPMPSTTTPTAVNYNKPVKLTLQESFVRIQKDADKQLKITKSLEALGLMRKGTADKAKAKYEARLDSLGEQVAVSLLKEGMSRLEVAQALQELPLSGEARDRLVKTYGVDVKKAKKETEFQQFYDAAGNPVARYIKGTPEYFEAVDNTDLRTDKPSATSDISDKVLESFTPESVIAFRSGGSKDTTLLVSAGGPMMEPKTQLDIRKAGRTDIGKLIKRPLEEIRKVITAVDKVKASLKRPSQAEIKAIEEKYGLDSKTDEGSKGIRQIALINSYQRLIDPATVREGDVALQRSAASLWEQTEMAIKRIREGTFLTESMEAEIARLANDFEYQIIRQFSPSLKDGERILKERYSDYKNFSDAGRKAEADLYSVLPKSEHEFIERRLKAQKNLILVRSKEFPIKLNPVDPEGDLAASNYLPGTYYLMPNETTPRVIKR